MKFPCPLSLCPSLHLSDLGPNLCISISTPHRVVLCCVCEVLEITPRTTHSSPGLYHRTPSLAWFLGLEGCSEESWGSLLRRSPCSGTQIILCLDLSRTNTHFPLPMVKAFTWASHVSQGRGTTAPVPSASHDSQALAQSCTAAELWLLWLLRWGSRASPQESSRVSFNERRSPEEF